MRIAFVDLLFSWPPNGGADVDLYNTILGMRARGHEVQLFVAGYERNWERGNVEPETLPFPARRLDFSTLSLRGGPMAKRFRAEVDAWKPDAVFVGDGFFLKPWVLEALAHYPLISRYYAYEVPCMRDLLLFKDGAPCQKNYLVTPNDCRKCALEGMKDRLLRWRLLSWQHEYVVSGAFLPGYHDRLTRGLAAIDVAIVYNDLMKQQLAEHVRNIHIVPGGVNTADYAYGEAPQRRPGERKIIFMGGRVEDPLKGFKTLMEAGEKLASRRIDFEIRATHTDHQLNTGWFRAVGWHSHEKVKQFYKESDICVVPSIWEEPFGLVAVEAMAAGRPVCASRVGGLQDVVRHEETGFLFARANSAELAAYLERLLDDGALRRRMGAAGRKRAEAEYDWARIIERYYPPIFEQFGLAEAAI